MPLPTVLAAAIEAVRRGEFVSFESLIAEYDPCVRNHVQSNVDARLRALVGIDDIVQEVWILAYRHMGQCDFPSDAAFRGWLRTLAANRIRDLRRRHFPRRPLGAVLPLATHSSDASEVADGAPSPQVLALRSERAQALDNVLASMPARQREVIRLVYVDRMPSTAIASRLGVSRDAVRSLLRRALDACEKALARSNAVESHWKNRRHANESQQRTRRGMGADRHPRQEDLG